MRVVLVSFAAVFLLAVASSVGVSRPGNPEPSGDDEIEARLERIRRLQEAGDHEQALARIDELLKTLPADAATARWEILFNGHLVTDVVLGAKYGYFFVSPFGASQKERPDQKIPDEYIEQDHNNRERTCNWTVTCVELASGKRLWTRPVYSDSYGIDPRDDALWTWPAFPQSVHPSEVRRIEPATGKVTLSAEVPPVPVALGVDDPRTGHFLGGIRDGVSVIRGRHDQLMHGRWWEGGFEFDLERRQHIPDAHPPHLLSRNRLAFLARDNQINPAHVSSVVLRPIGPHHSPVWSTEVTGVVLGGPVWVAGADGEATDVLAATGELKGAAYAVRLKGDSGTKTWSVALPEPAYTPETQHTAGSMSSRQTWAPLGEIAGYLFAIGGNTIYFLKPDTGGIAGSYRAPARLLDQPKLIDGNLVLGTESGMLAAPFERALSGGVPAWVRIAELRAGSLLALDRATEAYETAVEMTRLAPDLPMTWRTRALATARHPDAKTRGGTAATWARYQREAGLDVLPELEQSHGLLRWIECKPITSIIPVDMVLLVFTRAGEVLSIDAGTGEFIGRDTLPYPVSGLVLSGDTLYTSGADGKALVVRTFSRPPSLPPYHPLRTKGQRLLPAEIRDARLMAVGGGAFIDEDGTMVYPLPGGGVRVVRGDQFVELPPVVSGIKDWRLDWIGDRLLAWGEEGLWKIDENYRPAELLLRPEAPEDHQGHDEDSSAMYAVQSDGETLCIVAGPSRNPRLQIYTRDGKRLIREVRLVRFSEWPAKRQAWLLPLSGGYFFSGGQLTWLSTDPQQAPWQFTAWLPFEVLSFQDRQDSDLVFGVPLVVEDKLFVPGNGGVLVFSIDRLTARE